MDSEDLRRFQDWEAGTDDDHLSEVLQVESLVKSDGTKDFTSKKVPGRILGKEAIYERVGASKYVVDTIRDGYKLVFDSTPPPLFHHGGPCLDVTYIALVRQRMKYRVLILFFSQK